MSIRPALLVLASLLSFSSHALNFHDKDPNDELKDIKQSIEQAQNTLNYERTVNGAGHAPMPKGNSEKPSRSYFEIVSYDIYTSQSGKRVIQAMVTNHSGGGILLKPQQIKAFLSDNTYVEPVRIEQEGRFTQDETKAVTLHFADTQASILGLVLRSY
ncbi:hypothetical protein [Photobacterium lucens]|uniref:hypothetical protein n=1 Tax=Photobacterium lucens TaxID=2562949 RepID=UPI0006B4E2E8|nr:hypothetical protein [Photobacterium lucens]KPA51170.1 hypothetical protein VT25_20195 [Photobacterium leiognathi subsp. mandapamensis]MBP2700275.1 hypothetical protein [Vibrio parahaemolyticus]MZG55833.1 hypothetical protein [Photobacterium lucens]MZG81571.1 hypothetical protein [Photobacterium lucens]